MSEIKQLLNQTIIYGLSSVLARVLNFLLVPLYTILFIPSEYAVVTEMYAYAAFLIVVGSCGMETAFFRFTESKGENKSTIFSTSLAFLFLNAIMIISLGLIFYTDISAIIKHAQNPEYVLFFVFIIAIDLLTIIPFAWLRHRNQAIKFAAIKTISIIINIFFNIFFLLICPYLKKNNILIAIINLIYDPSISVGYVFVSNLIASGVTLLLLLPIVKKNIKKPDYGILKKMINYAWPILIGGVAFIINENLDKILLKYLLPHGIAMRELGIYSACYKLTIFMTLFVQAYRFAAEPFFFNQYSKPNAKKIYSNMLSVFVLYALFIFLLVVLNVDTIKLIIPNQLYHEGIIIIPIVLLANIFLGIYYNLSVWYKVTNKTQYAAIISSIGAIITIMLNGIFIPKFGYVGAAWATLFCYASMMTISFYFGQRVYKIKYNTKQIAYYFLFAAILFVASTFFENKIYGNIQIDNSILCMIYAIFIYTQTKRQLNPPV